jgi:hypothetical protein
MPKVVGRILVKETNQGVANLLVVTYETSSDMASQVLESAAAGNWRDGFGRRIASGIAVHTKSRSS